LVPGQKLAAGQFVVAGAARRPVAFFSFFVRMKHSYSRPLRWLLAGLLLLLLTWPVAPLRAQALARTFAGGQSHSLSIHADGTLWATGDNSNGQLGIPTSTTSSNTWVQVGTDANWVQVAAGGFHSLGLRADGSLYAWGANQYGQLGNGNLKATPTPTLVAGTYTQLAAGQYYSLGLRADGSLYAWGINNFGQLGIATNSGTATANATPTQVAGTYTQVAAGSFHSLGLRADGSLYAWGANQYGQLGNATNNDSSSPNPTPTQVAGTYRQVAGAGNHSLGLRADGSLWAWGSNTSGELGTTTNSGTPTPTPTPTQVAGTYTQVAGAGNHSLGLRADGSLYAWGNNRDGQLGTTTNNFTNTPNPTPAQVAGTYTQVVAGGSYSLALQADGSLYAWGSNSYGQLGKAANSGTGTPNPTPTATGTALVTRSLAMGASFGLAVKGDGTLWAWGDNAYGQLGLASTTARATRPVQVGTATDWVMVAAGEYHTLGLRADGSLYAWGWNNYGQLGSPTNSGTNAPTPTPQLVAGTYTQIAAGVYHSLALRADGSLYAWGSNQYGQLGTATNSGTSNANPAPTPVAGTYTRVAAGGQHSLALRADGTLYAWGDNSYGQLGPAATTSPTPTQVGGTYTQVAGGFYHTLGLRADGSLYAWGRNEYGQLGSATNNGTYTATPTPQLVAGTYTQVVAGFAHSLALRADGSLYAWGRNGNGELGIGTTNAATTPVPTQEATLGTGWTTLGPGSAATFSLVRTPSAQSFASAGWNALNQLGDGTRVDAPRFDRVNLLTGLQPLPVRPVAPGPGASLRLFPNPATAGTTLGGAMPGARVQVLDALGRLVLTGTTDAAGTATLALPAGLPAGVYVVRAGQQAARLVVE